MTAWSTPYSRRSACARSLGDSVGVRHAPEVVGVRVRHHDLAEVVEQRGYQQLVRARMVDLAGDHVGGPGNRNRVKTEALRGHLPARDSLEEPVDADPARERLDSLGRERAHSFGHRRYAIAPPLIGVRQAHHGDDKRDVRLDRGDELLLTRIRVEQHAQHAVARLGQSRHRVQALNRSRKPVAVVAHENRFARVGRLEVLGQDCTRVQRGDEAVDVFAHVCVLEALQILHEDGRAVVEPLVEAVDAVLREDALGPVLAVRAAQCATRHRSGPAEDHSTGSTSSDAQLSHTQRSRSSPSAGRTRVYGCPLSGWTTSRTFPEGRSIVLTTCGGRRLMGGGSLRSAGRFTRCSSPSVTRRTP